MGVNRLSLELFQLLLSNDYQKNVESRRIMSLGYPDIMVSTEDLSTLFGPEICSQLQFRQDSAEIISWHGTPGVTKVADANSLFGLLGFELDVIDIQATRGNEILVDLNKPISENLHQQYALVIDNGTCEHCFNFAQAIKNVANMVCLNGYAFQNNPINYLNHGFYNISPTLYYDFYLSNGFRMELCKYYGRFGNRFKTFDLPPYDRIGQKVPDKAVSYVIAKRMSIQSLVDPIQKKYAATVNEMG